MHTAQQASGSWGQACGLSTTLICNLRTEIRSHRQVQPHLQLNPRLAIKTLSEFIDPKPVHLWI